LNSSQQIKKVRGQALVELAVILPVIVLFIAAVIPLLVRGAFLPLLDERLALRQLSQDEAQVDHQLQITHSPDILPPYFEKTRLEENTQDTSMGMFIPLMSETFPGVMTRKNTIVTFSDDRWWNHALLGLPQERDQQISRNLTMVTSRQLVESRVQGEIKKFSFIGMTTGKTGFLEKAGFKLFHLNMDALPAKTREENRRNESDGIGTIPG
jgi:hypothetical protein